MSAKIPLFESEVRREICQRCPNQCVEFKDNKIDYTDAAASCGVNWPGRWGAYGVSVKVEDAAVVPTGTRAPSMNIRMRNLHHALRAWKKSGFKLAEKTEKRRRREICAECDLWDSKLNMGFGGCRICGCTKAKLWLASSKCPHPKGPKW